MIVLGSLKISWTEPPVCAYAECPPGRSSHWVELLLLLLLLPHLEVDFPWAVKTEKNVNRWRVSVGASSVGQNVASTLLHYTLLRFSGKISPGHLRSCQSTAMGVDLLQVSSVRYSGSDWARITNGRDLEQVYHGRGLKWSLRRRNTSRRETSQYFHFTLPFLTQNLYLFYYDLFDFIFLRRVTLQQMLIFMGLSV